MVAMFVRDEQRTKAFWLNPETGKPFDGRSRRKTAIDHHARFAGIDDQRIAPAAAAQRGKTHHFN